MEKSNLHDQPKPVDRRVKTHAGEDLQDRRCATCACSFLVEKPTVQPPGMSAQVFANLRDQRACRLNPPFTIQLPHGGQGLTQQPVLDDHVCWQWKKQGTLPGE